MMRRQVLEAVFGALWDSTGETERDFFTFQPNFSARKKDKCVKIVAIRTYHRFYCQHS